MVTTSLIRLVTNFPEICAFSRVLYAESSKLGMPTSEILNDLQLIVRS